MGLLQGPRLMAQTTKSPIRRNHWVPLGCRGHLGSVKTEEQKNRNFLAKRGSNQSSNYARGYFVVFLFLLGFRPDFFLSCQLCLTSDIPKVKELKKCGLL